MFMMLNVTLAHVAGLGLVKFQQIQTPRSHGAAVHPPPGAVTNNVALGAGYLRELLEDFGDLESALLAYNYGPNAARRLLAGPSAPALRAGYPRRVLDRLQALRALAANTSDNVRG